MLVSDVFHQMDLADMIREEGKMLLNSEGIEYYYQGNSQFYLEKIAWQNQFYILVCIIIAQPIVAQNKMDKQNL